jgi:hypothetical protein
MKNLDIVVIKSSLENLDKLNNRIYFEVERDGYHNHSTGTKEGIKTSIFIFNNLKNKDLLQTIVNGHEYVNKVDIYFGKIDTMEEYVAIEYSGKPTRLKIELDNGISYDIPKNAKEHLKL